MPSPNACSASARALGRRRRSSSGASTRRIPRPPPPAAALTIEREADALGVPQRLLDGLHRAAAPRRDRDAGLLGEPLGLDLVADAAASPPASGPTKTIPSRSQSSANAGSLGHEAPADPRGVGAGGDQRPLERAVVEVAAARAVAAARSGRGRRPRRPRGRTSRPLDVGEQRDQHDRLVALLVELAHGMDQPHRGLAAVDDKGWLEARDIDASELDVHAACRCSPRRSGPADGADGRPPRPPRRRPRPRGAVQAPRRGRPADRPRRLRHEGRRSRR